MRIVIADLETGRTQEIVARELTRRDQRRVTSALAKQGIQVEPAIDVFHVLHLWAKAPCTTAEEVAALAAYAEVTDARIAWHPARAGAVASC